MGGTERGGMGVIWSEREVPERQGIRDNEWARSIKYEAYPLHFALCALESPLPLMARAMMIAGLTVLEETNSLGRIDIVWGQILNATSSHDYQSTISYEDTLGTNSICPPLSDIHL